MRPKHKKRYFLFYLKWYAAMQIALVGWFVFLGFQKFFSEISTSTLTHWRWTKFCLWWSHQWKNCQQQHLSPEWCPNYSGQSTESSVQGTTSLSESISNETVFFVSSHTGSTLAWWGLTHVYVSRYTIWYLPVSIRVSSPEKQQLDHIHSTGWHLPATVL